MHHPTPPNPVQIPGKLGILEAIITPPIAESSHKIMGIICHPHPLHGGTMNNKVVTTVARAFNDLGASSLRFNYRGVGDSAGSYGQGAGETEDLLAVIHWVREQFPSYSIWLAGFSFGCYVAMRALTQTSADYLLTIAPAINHMDFSDISAVTVPWLLIMGDQDEVVPADQVVTWAKHLPKPPQLEIFSGASHFFHGRLVELREQIKKVLSLTYLNTNHN